MAQLTAPRSIQRLLGSPFRRRRDSSNRPERSFVAALTAAMGTARLRQQCVLGTALVAASFATANAQTQAQAPDFVNWRYDEDWSYLSDPSARTGTWWEPLKYIPVGKSSYLSSGLELRLRSEQFRNNLWGSADAPDDGYLWLRAMPHVDVHLDDSIRVFGQLIAADARGVEPASGPADETGIDVLQAFGEARLPTAADASLAVRAGRQLLAYGSERLVGIRYGPNVLQPFDGGVAILESGPWRLDGFYTRPVRVGTTSFDDETSDTRELWGVYVTRQRPFGAPGGIDLYYLGYVNETARFDQGSGHERRHTLGLRLFGSQVGWTWNWEAMFQFGSFGSGHIRAWSVGTETGYRFQGAPFRPLLRVRANITSGDNDPMRENLQTFNALFPKGKYFGELSPIGPYNIMNLHPSADFDLGDGFTLGLAGIAFWRQSRDDGLYDLPGNQIRPSAGSRARFVGTQAEVLMSWQANRNLEMIISYSALSPGRFIRQTGPAQTIHLLGLEATYRF